MRSVLEAERVRTRRAERSGKSAVTHDDDRAWMERDHSGGKARYWSAPNPAVGCVLLRDGVVLGEGFTQPAGNSMPKSWRFGSAGRSRL